MEWVVAAASSIAEAKERALDELGIDETEAEFEVLEEPTAGLFGKVRGEARVRARVVPHTPRPKLDRRERRGSSKAKGKRKSGGRTKKKAAKAAPAAAVDEATPDTASEAPAKKQAAAPKAAKRRSARSRPQNDSKKKSSSPTNASKTPAPTSSAPSDPSNDQGAPVSDITLSEQADATADFLRGLVDAFDYDGEVEIRPIDDDNIEVAVEGDDLGLMIGPRGATLQAIGELSRAASAQTLSGRAAGRVHLDVAKYRQKRREALAAFTEKVAADVIESGKAKALEPMAAADRKVVHDTCNDIDGVTTLSEGEDPRRCVVIEPST